MKRVVCPSCHKETTWEDNPSRPFCSERCRLIDLGRWATEEYRVALPEMLPDASVDLFDPTGPESAGEGERR
ncbi:MAG: DNA gyrase inhibitor YacG [Acidobacteriota bacterium]